MRKIAALFMLAVLLLSCAGHDSDIVIRLSVDHPGLRKIKVALDEKDIRIVELDSLGRGTLVLSGCDNVYSTIYHISRDPVCKAFLKKGSKVSLSIDAQECRMPRRGSWRKGYSFSDRTVQEISEYVTNIRIPKMPEAFDKDLDGYVHVIDSLVAKATATLDEREELAGAEAFKKVERKRIAYSCWRHLLDYPEGRSTALGKEYAPDETFLALVRERYAADPELLWCPEYVDYMLAASKFLGDNDFRSIQDKSVRKRLLSAE